MRRIVILPSFERSFKKLSSQEKRQAAEALEAFNTALVSRTLSTGFGFKKINRNKYEFRVTIRLRIVMKAEREILYLVLIGNHDEVKRYLRNYR